MTPRLALAFLLSGAAGLIYEVVWSRYLALLLGHSAYAQVTVLVIFLGGLSLGAALVARRAEGRSDPLRWYVGLELAVGGYALLFPALFHGTSALAYDVLLPALGDPTLARLALIALSAALILPPSVILGATFPFMAAGLLRRVRATGATDQPGRPLALLYGINSVGGAVGVLVAGFLLVPAFGFGGALAGAALLNGGAALLAWPRAQEAHGLAEPAAVAAAVAAPIAAPVATPMATSMATPTAPADEAPWGVLLTIATGTAFASFLYQIGWTRLLSLILGSATHAFEIMLSAFILGLALGSLVVRRIIDRGQTSLRLLGLVQLAMGLLAIATVGPARYAFEAMVSLTAAAGGSEGAYLLYNLGRYGIALGVMLPATLCAGMTLPLITRALLVTRHGERAIGAVYAWNTLGSILGAGIAALWLLPLLGVRHLVIQGGAIDIALGLWLLWREVPRQRVTRPFAVATTLIGLGIVGGAMRSSPFDPVLLASGVFRDGRLLSPDRYTIPFHAEGRTANVSVLRRGDFSTSLTTNGKADASLDADWFRPPLPVEDRPALDGDGATQLLLALITLGYAPRAEHAAVIGHGSGMSSHVLLGSPYLRSLRTIEIEPQMVRASQLFLPLNARVFTDPRSTILIEDARASFATRPDRYDLILSEPSNPWVSGVSSLFTEEFYARVRDRLAPGGVFGQWIHLYELSDDLVLSVIAAVHRQFPTYVIHETDEGNLLIVATASPALPAPDWSVRAYSGIVDDLARFRPLTPAALDGTMLLRRADLVPLFAQGTIRANSDLHPLLDVGAERTRILRRRAKGFEALGDGRFDLVAALAERPTTLGPARPTPLVLTRLERRSLAALLQTGIDQPLGASGRETRVVLLAHLRADGLQAVLQSDRAPNDWGVVMQEVWAVEGERHGGVMGWVDTAWYAGIEGFAARMRAPAEVGMALRFHRAAMTYQWAAAARELPGLLTADAAGHHWIPVQTLLPAAVIARVRTGDVTGARAALTQLLPAAGWGEDDLRTRLLRAGIAAAERGGGPTR